MICCVRFSGLPSAPPICCQLPQPAPPPPLPPPLSPLSYDLSVRNALGGGTSSDRSCFRNLRHEFILVRGSEDYAGIE